MIVAIIPARGGSKRIPRKNLALLNGRPLLRFTVEAALGALGKGKVFVSTEDGAIAAEASSCGAGIVNRPAQLATDSASTESVLMHAMQDPCVREVGAEWVMTLPPTSPLRDSTTIREFLTRVNLDANAADCYFSVTETRADYWQRIEGGEWRRLFPDAPRRQQERSPLFEENSAIYLTRIDALRGTGSILGGRAKGIAITAREGFDINSPDDLAMAELIVAAHHGGAAGGSS